MIVDVKSVLQTGKDIFGRPWFEVIYPSYGDFKLPVYIWLATFSAKIFGLSQWSFRLPSELAGIGTIVVGGFLAKFLTELGISEGDEVKAKRASERFFSQIFQLST